MILKYEVYSHNLERILSADKIYEMPMKDFVKDFMDRYNNNLHSYHIYDSALVVYRYNSLNWTYIEQTTQFNFINISTSSVRRMMHYMYERK